jgi:hypothetical protein
LKKYIIKWDCLWNEIIFAKDQKEAETYAENNSKSKESDFKIEEYCDE